MGRLPDNYFGPKQRVLMLKKDHPGTQSAVLTTAQMLVVGDALCFLIKASIQVDGVIVAEGHAFTDTPEDDKAVEKAETIAIGRALVNYGYPETLDVEEEEEKASKPVEKKSSGLGSKGLGKPATKKEEADESTDSETSGETEEEAERPKPTRTGSGGLGGLRTGAGKGVQQGLGSSKTGEGARSNAKPLSVPSDVPRVSASDESGVEEEDSEEAEEKEEVSTQREVRKPEASKSEAKEEGAKPKMTREELLAKYKKK